MMLLYAELAYRVGVPGVSEVTDREVMTRRLRMLAERLGDSWTVLPATTPKGFQILQGRWEVLPREEQVIKVVMWPVVESDHWRVLRNMHWPLTIGSFTKACRNRKHALRSLSRWEKRGDIKLISLRRKTSCTCPT